MSNEAAERLRERIMEYPSILVIEELTGLLDAALAHERSAGAAPLDVERLAKALSAVERITDVGWPNMDERDLAQLILAQLTGARLSEGTDRLKCGADGVAGFCGNLDGHDGDHDYTRPYRVTNG